MSLDKYIHSEVENKIYSYWEKNKLFKPKINKLNYSKYSSIWGNYATRKTPKICSIFLFITK